jgi:DNA helicase HerA-like ATPase
MPDGKSIGTVVSTFEGPSTDKFSFVIDKKEGVVPVRKDEFVSVDFEDGQVVASVEGIRKTNKYFARAETVREYGKETEISSLFPIDSWEFLVADAKVLGVFAKTDSPIGRPTFPVSPGSVVRKIETSVLEKFLGFEEGGIELGKVEHHNLTCRLKPSRLFQKHLAILAMSGAGKSHLTRVLIEEILDRKKEQGRLGIVVIDIHGEYSSFADPGLYQSKTVLIDCSELRIALSDLSGRELAEFIPSITTPQKRALERAVRGLREEMREKGNTYDLSDIISRVEAEEELKKGVKEILASLLEDLESLRLFSAKGIPPLSGLVLPGTATIFDLSKITGARPKQIIVSYVTKRLFDMRKRGLVCPYVEIVEEAHNFAPEKEKHENALARGILNLIAREGRKFCASLVVISQRPVHLSTTVLSQCNTHIIMRVTNPYDLDHIKQSSEGISSETVMSITGLRVGEAFIVGEAVNHPVPVKIRDRKSPKPRHSRSLEETAREFEETLAKRRSDASEFV